MNYKLLYSNGLKHGDNAGDVWHKRAYNLITYWCKCREDNLTFSAQRVSKIIQELEERVKQCGKQGHEILIAKEEYERSLSLSYLELSCPSFKCRYAAGSYGVVIPFRDYKPGLLKCDNCGKSLETEQEKEIEKQLCELNIWTY